MNNFDDEEISPEESLFLSKMFIRLKDVCDPVAANPTVDNVRKLYNSLKHIPPYSCQRLQSYMMYPIELHLFGHTSKLELKLNLLYCLKVVLSKTVITCVSKFFHLNLLLLGLISEDKLTKIASVNEDLKHDVVDCITALFQSAECSILLDIYNYNNRKHVRIFQATTYACLYFAYYEKYMKLRRQSLICLLAMARADDSASLETNDMKLKENLKKFIARSLPGITITCFLIMTSGSKLHHSLTIAALRLFGRIVSLALEDEDKHVNTSIEQPASQLSSSDEDDHDKSDTGTSEWIAKTAGEINDRLRGIRHLAYHSNHKVRKEFLNAVIIILSKCFNNLELCVLELVNSMMLLSHDEVTEISETSKIYMSKFLNDSGIETNIKECMEENMDTVLSNIDALISSSNEDELNLALKLLNSYLNFLDLRHVMNSFSHLEHLVSTMMHVVQVNFFSSLDYGVPIEELNDGDKRSTKFVRNTNTMLALADVCYTLAVKGNADDFLTYLLDIFHNDPTHRLQSIFLINSITLNPKKKINTDDVSYMRDILSVYMDPDVWYVPIVVNSEDRLTTPNSIRNNVLQICLLTEGIGNIALCMRKNFKRVLYRCVYQVLEKASSPNELISSAGKGTVMHIISVCEYLSVEDFITRNMDFIIHQVSQRLRNDKRNTRVFDVISFIMKNTSIKSMSLLLEIIEAIINSKYMLNEGYCEGFLNIFVEFTRHLRCWHASPMINTLFDSTIEKPDNYTNLLKHLVNVTGGDDSYWNTNDELKDINDVDQLLTYWIKEREDMNEKEEFSNEKEEEKEIPKYVYMIKHIVNRVLNMLPFYRDVKLKVLNVLMNSIVTIYQWESEYLQIVHKIWSPLVTMCFKESTNAVVIRRSFELLMMISATAKDFIKSRTLKDVLPALIKVLDVSKNKSIFKDSKSIYRTSQEYKLQNALLCNLGHLAVYIQLDEKDLESILSAATPYLSVKQPTTLQRSAMELIRFVSNYNEPLVWLHLVGVWSEIPIFTSDNPYFKDIKIKTDSSKNSEFRQNITILLKGLDEDKES